VTTVTYESSWLERPSFWSVFWAVLRGYFFAACTVAIPYFALLWLGFFDAPEAMVRPGPYPVTGPWSFDVDLVLAAAVVLVAGAWIRDEVRRAVDRPVSLPVVVAVVALTGYARRSHCGRSTSAASSRSR
jgi:hypothetical protein